MSDTLLAVDLAARFSAACHLDLSTGHIIDEFDSWGRTDDEFIDQIAERFWGTVPPPATLVIEDLPHKLPFDTIVRQVCRLQGRLIDRLYCMRLRDRIRFVAPADWRRHYTGLERGTGPTAVVPVANALGYHPPDLTGRALGVKNGRVLARKVATDYCAAYLIARWARETAIDLEPVNHV